MKVVVAPDSFKGSISAIEICESVKRGILQIFPEADVRQFPLADGGEGTMENLVYSTSGRIIDTKVRGPLEKIVKAGIGLLGDGETVIIEMAQASGLPLIKEGERDPFLASSFGTGQLIKHALDLNYRKFIVGLGGSATNDAGAGMLKALGVKFFNEGGEEISEGGKALDSLSYYDDAGLDARIKESEFIIASDVTNPLYGSNGASAIYGPQKGASVQQVAKLDEALKNFSDVVLKQKGTDIQQIAGGGAAGGMGASLVAFMGAEMRSGIEVVMETIQFKNSIKDTDLIITGEGKLDSQTLAGKVISGVTKIAKPFNIPVIALCGTREICTEEMDALGLAGAFTIVPGPCSLETARENAAVWIQEQTEQIMRFMKKMKEEDHHETKSFYN